MTPIKIVLSNGEHDEHELGEYSQGVVFDTTTIFRKSKVIDIASGEVITTQEDGYWVSDDIGQYSQLFVHPVEVEPRKSPQGRPRKWTKERIDGAIMDWYVRYGEAPGVKDWLRAEDGHPAASTAIYWYGSWTAALDANGLEPRGTGQSKERSRS